MKSDGAVTAGPERPQHFLERQDLLNQGDSIPAQIGTESVGKSMNYLTVLFVSFHKTKKLWLIESSYDQLSFKKRVYRKVYI